MRTLRKLILGETWFLPLGIVLVLGLGALVSAIADELWREAGGILLLVAVGGLLVASVRRG